MTAPELLDAIRKANPGVRYARTKNGNAVGEFVPTKNRFVPVFLAELNGSWVKMIVNGSIREILTNGEPMYRDADWVE